MTFVPDHPHMPVQHRDGKLPWCNECGLDRYGVRPTGAWANLTTTPKKKSSNNYKTRSTEVLAIQAPADFDEYQEALKSLHDWVCEVTDYQQPVYISGTIKKTLALIIGGKHVSVNPGYWIVKDRYDTVDIHNDRSFHHLYEEI